MRANGTNRAYSFGAAALLSLALFVSPPRAQTKTDSSKPAAPIPSIFYNARILAPDSISKKISESKSALSYPAMRCPYFQVVPGKIIISGAAREALIIPGPADFKKLEAKVEISLL